MTVFVNADWSKVVPEGSVDAAFGVAEADVDARGLTDALATFNVEQAEDYARRNTAPEPKKAPQPEVVEDEHEVKEAPTPPNKAAGRPSTK